MKKNVLSCDYEFHQAAAAADGASMERAVLGFLTTLLNFWLEQTHEAFENFLRIFKQKYARAKRALGVLSSRESCIFYLGVLYAIQQIFETLYLAECQEEYLVSTFAKQSPRSEKILLCLYRNNGGSGMRHGELAEALSLSDSALTNAMKRVLQSGAAEASRYGKNTFYTLSKAGRRYCAEREKKTAAGTGSQAACLSWLWQAMQLARGGVTAPALLAGDELAHVIMDGVDQGRYRVQEILQTQDAKSVNLEKVPEDQLQEVVFFPGFYIKAPLGEMNWENSTAI